MSEIIKVKVDPSDLKRFRELCEKYGITPEQLLEGFIADLTFGEKNHGSDERMMAVEYVERCYLIPRDMQP